MTHLDSNQLTLVYFEEAPESDRQHMSECEECRVRYEELARFLDAMRAVSIPEKGPEWERRIWNAIEPEARVLLSRKSRRLYRWWVVPALAGMLAVAFLGGMYTQRHAEPKTFSAQARQRVLLIALGDHMDRSQIVLAELVNAPEGRRADISTERQIAGGLLGENRLLRQTAARTGDIAAAATLDQLERVLLDIAHSPDEVTPRELDDLREQIEAQGLLFKVRVVSANAREKRMML